MSQVNTFPCAQCGAQLEYQPGTTQMKCPYCGFAQAIAPPSGSVEELSYDAFLHKATLDTALEKEAAVRCDGCGASFTVPANQETKECPFCGSRVIVAVTPENRIAAQGLLNFVINDKQARQKLNEWLGSRFWAPNDLKDFALKEGRLKGMYIPFWTYDSDTRTHYTGMRGEAYYVEVSDTDSDGNQTTRTERRINWYPASGLVDVSFDDLLVLASKALPETYAQRLREWDLPSLIPYDNRWLVGFQTMRYDVDLSNGYGIAQQMMVPEIRQTICYDIGGDEQQITSMNTEYYNITFKHILLPIWVGGFRYKEKSFRIVVNGRTGEIQGEAPISFWKVLIAVILGLIVLGLILMLTQGQHR